MLLRHVKKGFSLIEVLLYLSLAGVLVLVSSFYFFQIMESRIRNQVISEVDWQGAQIMQTISQILRNANSIISPPAGGNSTNLSLDVTGANPTIFDVSSGNLRISEAGQPAQNLNSSNIKISNVVFYNFSRTNTDGIITIRYTVSYMTTTSRFEYNYSKDFYGTAALR